MTHIENLKIGQWVAVVSVNMPEHEQRNDYDTLPPWLRGYQRPAVVFDGEPMLIIGISTPFLAVVVPQRKEVITIDCRRFGVTVLAANYVNALLNDPVVVEWLRQRQHKFELRCDKKMRDVSICQRCGESRVLRIAAGDACWSRVCPQCGLSEAEKELGVR